MKPELIYDLLNRAILEELGLVIETNNPQALALQIHEVKKSSERYSVIEVTTPSTPNTLMLVKKSVELDEPVFGDLPDV